MRLFKRRKTNENTVLQLGITECRICKNNIRCEECVYPSENKSLKEEIERLKEMVGEG